MPDGGKLSNNKGHQIRAHVDTRLFKLILHEAIGKYGGLHLKNTALRHYRDFK